MLTNNPQFSAQSVKAQQIWKKNIIRNFK